MSLQTGVILDAVSLLYSLLSGFQSVKEAAEAWLAF